MWFFKKNPKRSNSVPFWMFAKKFILSGIAAIVLGAAFIMPGLNKTELAKSAAAPRFNFLQGDHEMLRGAHQSDQTWSDPINANIGDQVAVLFYYHNGIVGSVAHHTTMRVDLPMEQGTQLKLTNYLWSQETSPISDTIVNGSIVGQTGLTINLPSNGRIEYVAGSTKWYPNGATVGQHVPDAIVSQSGLDIGDVQGCWNYAGFVSFLVNIKGEAKLVMDKKVAHAGDATWQDEIVASAGDEVAYSLAINNTGNTLAQQVTVKDMLPTYMNFIPGTTYVHTKENPAGYKAPDTIFSTGLALADILPGVDNLVSITYKTKIDSNLPNDQAALYLNNVAKVFMGGVEQDQDQAKVTVHMESRTLSLAKMVRSGDSWVKQNSADLNQEIEYQITVKNTGNVDLANVSVRDVLPVYVNYIAGSTKINGQSANDQIISQNGLLFATVKPGEIICITFKGIIYGCPPVGGYTLYNTAYAHADSVVEIWDSASTVVNIAVPNLPVLN